MNNRRKICFFHRTDLDGHCSGAIIKLRYPETELIGIDYADKYTAQKLIQKYNIDKTVEIFMVDFSLHPFSEMVELIKNASKFTWCDHHKTALEAYKEWITSHDVSSQGHLFFPHIDDKRAGCELTWTAVFPRFDQAMPPYVRLLGRYDVWDHEDKAVVPFQYAMRSYETNPQFLDWQSREENIWQRIYRDYTINGDLYFNLINIGNTLLDYIKKDNKGLSESSHFICHIGDLRCVAVNKLGGNSQVFDAIWDGNFYDAMVIFGFNGKVWRFSIFTSKNIDVSAVAKKLGGGGHAKAAGWTCDSLPFIEIGETSVGRKIYQIPLPT